MTGYAIFNINVNNPENYKEYVEKVKPTAERFGGEYLVRGGKKRIRGTGTGVHERTVSGHGKGRVRGETKGRIGRTDVDVSQREKRGTIHGKSRATQIAEEATKRHSKKDGGNKGS